MINLLLILAYCWLISSLLMTIAACWIHRDVVTLERAVTTLAYSLLWPLIAVTLLWLAYEFLVKTDLKK